MVHWVITLSPIMSRPLKTEHVPHNNSLTLFARIQQNPAILKLAEFVFILLIQSSSKIEGKIESHVLPALLI